MQTYTNYTTPAEFNTGYANSITPDVVAKWETIFRQDSAAILSRVPCQRDLAYGQKERNRLDFFPAQTASPDAPLLVAIHGGLWFLFDKWLMHFLADVFTQSGFHVAAINYPLAPENSLGTIVEDCRAAVAWLHAQAGEFGIRRDAISVLGHSAAGQLAAMVSATRWDELDPALPRQIIHRCVGVSGFYDIEPFGRTDFQPFVKFSDEDYRLWNPVTHVAPHLPATLLITGGDESSLLHQMAGHYADALRKANVAVEKLKPSGESHFSVLHEIGRRESPVFEKAIAFLTS